MEITFRALDGWPDDGPKPRQEIAKFKASYSKTTQLLIRELEMVGAREIVLQTGHYPRDIRRDGIPAVNARSPRFPGVILTFKKHNAKTKLYDTLSFPCATYNHWEDNLRAIALSLESLRAVDRYGVTRQSEQYAGWTKRIDARTGTEANGKVTPETAAEVLAACAGVGHQANFILARPEEMERAYKAAARETHPDFGGSAGSMAKVSEAARVLREHFKGKSQ